MRKILDIALNDLKIVLKDPGAWFGMFGIPIVMAWVLGIGLGGSGNGPTRVRVDVIDSDNSELSMLFMQNLREANSTLTLCPMDNNAEDFCNLGDDPVLTEERSVNRLSNNAALALIQIPAGFEEKLTSSQPVAIIYRSNENASAPSYILQAVQAVTQRMNGAVVASSVGVNIATETGVLDTADLAAQTEFQGAVYDRALELWETNPFSVDYQVSQSAGQNQPNSTQVGFGQSFPGMATMFVLFFVLLGAVNLTRERKNWTLQRLVTMPLSRGQLLGGKILAYFLMGILQYTAIFAVGRIAGLNLGNDLFALAVVMVAFTLCATALSFVVSTFVKTEMQAATMLNLLGLTLAPLGGAWWPLDIVPEFMKVIGHISPIAWAMDAFKVLLFENGTLSSVLLPVGVLLALAVVFFGVAVARFKVE
ncbi:MAG: ABC transporter permease [Anaerolineae bacterium]|nr:ABC transporter permease [Anaerolineae bacterium]